ncbi:O-antigen ligase family protein, partial [Clostridium beijerinckii]|uniref:O-antigen ligase family protein n=1 Tax=Clostridium beijerinckii TaxID=1520 RepID=UPI0022DF6D9F
MGIFLIGIIYKIIYGYNYKKIVDFFSYLAIYNGLLAVAQYITEKKLLIGQFNKDIYFITETGEQVKRVVGIAITNNAAGNLGCILFAVVLSNYLRTKGKIHLIALMFTSIFSILTLTRIGYIGIGIVIFINFLISKWNSMGALLKRLMVIMIVMTIVGIVVYLFGNEIFYVLFEQRGNTQDARVIQFKFIFNNIIKNNNFWSGIGTGQYEYYTYNFLGYRDIDIHSEYLNILAENGILNFI